MVKRLQRIEKEMSGEARKQFGSYIINGDVGKYAASLPRQLRQDFIDTMTLLRDKSFQDLLVNYPRKERTFIIAVDNQDSVSSSWLIRGADGREYRPEDYLTAFARYVRENPDKIEAIRILLKRPKDWSTKALTEPQLKLGTAPQRFTVENLRKVHELHYHKAVADIISMVKHAANEQQPLYTAEERVKLAVAKITAGKNFTPEQLQWLDRIEARLAQNLSIDRDDFDTLPVFNRYGGWGRADKVFEGQLPQLIN